ncbi:hypothetical protein GQ43DRAFT_428157 [Delitschia confertaspora ATCC 74209]|uniref:Uncharacterized protein n=1 Tax=Delitschia confertaspora ATCC 74209 TaxID=1513339 RepID=A0A9P4MTK0_9PLEO|nr:hypothetical protein GQ43DRAFT_428157 [Delitschia confertaspora ATCC 74209]
MINALKLSELLTKNVDPDLYPRMFVMSPNGTLLAYSTPVDIKELRDQAALISMAWKEQDAALQAKAAKGSIQSEACQSSDSSTSSVLETLTIEFQHNNVIVRAIQPKLLLVLVGGVPPNRKPIFKMTPEAYGGARYPSAERREEVSTSQLQQNPSISENVTPERAESSARNRNTPSIASSTMSQKQKDIKLGILHIQRKKLDAMSKYLRAEFDAKSFVMPDDGSFP